MFLRQATAFLRRIRFPFQSFTTLCTRTSTNSSSFSMLPDKMGVYTWRKHQMDLVPWILLSGQAAIILGINGNPALAEDVSVELGGGNDTGDANLTGLRRIEDGSVISNQHTSKWRIFTDNARDLFLQGKLDEAEKYFLLALQEAKEGFGERDPHVASACNNLAELYRVKKEFDKAEPLYLEAINILEESFGPEDIRVGAAFHNLGQFYLAQRELEEARICYERALKIKGRVLGHGHTDYADTMYHLGMVLYLRGKQKDSEALIQDSVRILEECGQGESMVCLRRLRYLAKIYLKSNRLTEAENAQRKILHILELSKGWNSLDTVVAAESLALTLQSIENLTEAQELLERCLDVRKSILQEDHIQIGANMLHLARVAMLKSNRLRKVDISEANIELDKAKVLLDNSIRIPLRVLDNQKRKRRNKRNNGEPRETRKDEHTAVVILLQALNAFGLVEITKQELQDPWEECPPLTETENAVQQCISAFKEPGVQRIISDDPEVKAQYLSCLKHISILLNESSSGGERQSRRTVLQELNDEIKRIEAELSANRKHRN